MGNLKFIAHLQVCVCSLQNQQIRYKMCTVEFQLFLTPQKPTRLRLILCPHILFIFYVYFKSAITTKLCVAHLQVCVRSLQNMQIRSKVQTQENRLISIPISNPEVRSFWGSYNFLSIFTTI